MKNSPKKIRPFESDAATSAGTPEACEPRRKGHTETLAVLSIALSGSVVVIQIKLDEGELVVPCLCQVFCRNLFYEKVLPCLIVSVLKVLAVLGSQSLKQQKNEMK